MLMKPFISYQFADSSLMNKKFGTSPTKDSGGLKLLKEVDETTISKHNSQETKTLFAPNLVQPSIVDSTTNTAPLSLELIDTATFGITEQTLKTIPIRKEKQSKKTTETTLILYQPSYKKTVTENWEIIVLLFSILLIASAKGFSQNRFKSILKSVFSTQATYEIVRGEKIFFNRTNLLLNLVYLSTSSLFIYQILRANNFITSPSQMLNYITIFLWIGLFYVLKLLVNNVLNVVFDTKEIIIEYIYNTSLFNNIIGVILLPILFFNNFTDFQNNIFYQKFSLVLISIILLLRTRRYIKLGLKKYISILHIFLYICSLEILPLIVIIKVIILK